LDGYPSEYLMGMDIEQSYIDCGYMLFKDSPETCPIQFIVDTTDNWQPEEKMFVVHAGSVFHLFMDGDTTRAFIKRIVKMLRPGGILVGGHVCTDQSMQYYRPSTKSLKFYMGLEDFKEMLISEGFSDIEIETMSRLGDEEEDFKAFWISFYAAYHPISSK
jgi:trans-aconitate methyltransferase